MHRSPDSRCNSAEPFTGCGRRPSCRPPSCRDATVSTCPSAAALDLHRHTLAAWTATGSRNTPQPIDPSRLATTGTQSAKYGMPPARRPRSGSAPHRIRLSPVWLLVSRHRAPPHSLRSLVSRCRLTFLPRPCAPCGSRRRETGNPGTRTCRRFAAVCPAVAERPQVAQDSLPNTAKGASACAAAPSPSAFAGHVASPDGPAQRNSLRPSRESGRRGPRARAGNTAWPGGRHHDA